MPSALLLILLSAVSSGQAAERTRETAPQARPVAVLLTAVKDGDLERFKNVFSERMRGQFDKEGWDLVMKTYQAAFKKEFGEYMPEAFSFLFKGSDNLGTVSILYQGKTLPGLRVTREKNEWRVDER